MISDILLSAFSLSLSSRATGDIVVEGDAIMKERRTGRGTGSGSSRSSMPRYLYKSVCACASARFPDEDDDSSDEDGHVR